MRAGVGKRESRPRGPPPASPPPAPPVPAPAAALLGAHVRARGRLAAGAARHRRPLPADPPGRPLAGARLRPALARQPVLPPLAAPPTGPLARPLEAHG